MPDLAVVIKDGIVIDGTGAQRNRADVGIRNGRVAKIPIDHFDGLNTFEDLPRDGRCVADYWL